MNKAKAKDDSKGLDKLLKLSVLGTALIIVVYSVYYYSNAYKHSRTNLYIANEESDLEVVQSVGAVFNDYKPINTLGTYNHRHALYNGTGGWKYPTKSAVPQINERTTAAMSGLISEGFEETFSNELKKKFHNAPPVLINPEDEIAVRSIQFEHFVFPYHAMINWRKEGNYKTFSFYSDSIGGNLKIASNGFKWISSLHSEYVKVINQTENAGKLADSLQYEGEFNTQLIEMPVIDFDVLYSVNEHIGLPFLNGSERREVTESKGELKILIGPSLKQNSAYTINSEGKKVLEIKPPFTIEVGNSKNEKPYFSALIVNEKLLLK